MISIVIFSILILFLNPIRSGLFQTVNDPGGRGGFKSPPPYDLKNYCVNLHHIIHVDFTRCFRHDPIGIFQIFVIETQIETYGISHPADSPVVSCENSMSYPARHFDSISSGPSCDRSIPVSPDISCDSAISSSCHSNPVSQTPVDHDSFSVPPIFFNGQSNYFISHCNSFETVSNFGDFHGNSYGNLSFNPMYSHDVQDHPISQSTLVFSEDFGPISSTHVSHSYPQVPILLPHPLDHPQMLPPDLLDLFVLHKVPHQCMTTLPLTRISLT